MKRSVCLLSIVLFVSILSGCILSKTPSSNSVTMNLGEQKTFSINVFPHATYTWTLDGGSISNTGNSYVYTAQSGQHSLTVQAKYIFGTDTQTWNIITNNNCSLPAAPSDVLAIAGIDQVTISWSPVSGATSYNIYWSTTSGVNYHQISVAESPYIHTGLTYGVTYYYVVTAMNACGDESSYSNEISVVPELSSRPIANAGADQMVAVDTTVTLNGSKSIGVGNDIVSYVWQQIGGPIVTLTNANTSTVSFTASVAVGSSLTFELTVTDAIGLQATDTCVIHVIHTFQKMYGGSRMDMNWSIQQTNDGGCIIAGGSISTDIPGVTTYGYTDVYIIKLDTNGSVVWQKMYGGSGDDAAMCIRQTSDGGYIVAGGSGSTDIPGVINHGSYDYYILKLDANGEVVWQKMFGGSGTEVAHYVNQTSDGGYIVAGSSDSTDIPGVINHGGYDKYVLKLDVNGEVVWQKMYGGSGDEKLWEGITTELIQQTSDGGYIIAEHSNSTDIPGVINHGGDDYYIIKINTYGEVVWEKMYGGSGSDMPCSVQQTSDGGYIVAGISDSTDIPGVINNENSPCYILKLDANGEAVWQKMYGGWGYAPFSVLQTSDGGYILGFSGNVVGNILKLDTYGEVVWQKTYELFLPLSVHQTSDGGYIFAGVSFDPYSSDMSLCILRLDRDGETIRQRMYSRIDSYFFYSYNTFFKQTIDGGYIIAGPSTSTDIPGVINHGSYDYYVLKIDQYGNL